MMYNKCTDLMKVKVQQRLTEVNRGQHILTEFEFWIAFFHHGPKKGHVDKMSHCHTVCP